MMVKFICNKALQGITTPEHRIPSHWILAPSACASRYVALAPYGCRLSQRGYIARRWKLRQVNFSAKRQADFCCGEEMNDAGRLPDPVAEAFRRAVEDAQATREVARPPAAREPPRPDWIDRLITVFRRLLGRGN
jgi:hypothetical protein